MASALPMPFPMLLAAAAFGLGAAAAPADEGTARRMRIASEALIASVPADARSRLVLPFAGSERTNWHYTPRSRAGLSFADLDGRQRELVHGLLRAALSEAGHRKVVNIIELELVLKEMETFGLLRDPEKYFVVFFGDPHPESPWGWRFEGHHLSLNFTLRGSRPPSTSPSFFGANPARVPSGPKAGLRTLAGEEDEGRRLLAMLDGAQRRVAVVSEQTYGDIVTGAADRVSPLEGRGLEARAMGEAQRTQLRRLIEAHAASFEPALRDARLARASQDFDAVRFAWAGATGAQGAHYYRVQGPKFLLEYDASQNGGNHIHAVWRDFTGDFGRDLLRDHYTLARGTRHRH